MSATATRTIGSCQNYIEHLARHCARSAMVEFHEHDTETDTVTALPVCRQHGNKLVREAKIVRHRKAWLTALDDLGAAPSHSET